MIKARGISKGRAEGEVIITRDAISFLGGVDPERGVVREAGHELYGRSISGKVLVFPRGKGSTVGSYVIYQLKKKGLAPVAMINQSSEPIVAIGAIISGIPLVDKPSEDIFRILKDGDRVIVDGDLGLIELIDR
ncbi:MAG TPA: DUF126 domain-containing protein [Candidatus Syntrophoarchaeum butanivorans]|uniref:Phosphomevalonate dehydratase small subunit n=1 Tax=Candidatus Syntropharchaeum butanivorans TaxID=1839936 RepID=A0A7J2S2E3_9EURY|nr:MAG: DUF126 domain-containing protein [Candidatus Syntrophoarchaeum sp. WYZ-LMO15]RLG98999.1 MAG: hypothetical protein DRO38_08300 [Candidatus Bathyarchaeota archaeon]HEC57641.1 DUF126 domain-containing protein [Candidatus Syntrophoarchaeum butanivorans]